MVTNIQSPKPAAESIPSSSVSPAEVAIVRQPFKVLLEWEAFARPYKARNREYFTTIGAIVFLLAVILLFLKEWLLIGAIIAFAFLNYVLASVPPEKVNYKLTTRGVVVAGKTYFWSTLGRYWFSLKWGIPILHIEHWGLPPQLLLLFDEKVINKDQLKEAINKYLIYEKPEKTVIDKASEWLQKKVPLETEPASPQNSTK
ncbi:hypothetical protein A2160_04555 [Candidatus Beckwithbacteria bacterium RBG_13_42_9]|uniref:DUF5673 domain-containing protein n=1 Tax=Candidatus Beckwithbacteria bacterium RBG_13_42_9 TaxID=1797457 RepID=A0A1F5E9G3_9BACT|nr:MAG: hypothetical protein A2160_04555 [Candidatus Beckwithbacteria bacterium RBG_13_42_9]